MEITERRVRSDDDDTPIIRLSPSSELARKLCDIVTTVTRQVKHSVRRGYLINDLHSRVERELKRYGMLKAPTHATVRQMLSKFIDVVDARRHEVESLCAYANVLHLLQEIREIFRQQCYQMALVMLGEYQPKEVKMDDVLALTITILVVNRYLWWIKVRGRYATIKRKDEIERILPVLRLKRSKGQIISMRTILFELLAKECIQAILNTLRPYGFKCNITLLITRNNKIIGFRVCDKLFGPLRPKARKAGGKRDRKRVQLYPG